MFVGCWCGMGDAYTHIHAVTPLILSKTITCTRQSAYFIVNIYCVDIN